MSPGNAKRIFWTLLSAGITLILSIFLHELGHCIAALTCGAKITSFSILTAHVSSVGGNYTGLTKLWLNANGMLLPLLASLLYMLLYRRENTAGFYRIISFFFALIPSASLLAWVYLPVLYLLEMAPQNDDVTKFLEVFSPSANPLLVSAAAMLLIGVSVWLMVKKGIPQNYFQSLKNL